ncbi:hypothetical protein, partial [Mycobacterium avium]|uniref:hypothetical protein n=1 Tax=Mycobacterium avium TaxID=1764 RepID=UPI001E31F797
GAGAEPDVEAALPIHAVDLFFDAGGHDLHWWLPFGGAAPEWRRRCAQCKPGRRLPIPTTSGTHYPARQGAVERVRR